MPTTSCPDCGGDLIDHDDYLTCEDCEFHNQYGSNRSGSGHTGYGARCAITLLEPATCTHCTGFKAAKWVNEQQPAGYSAPIRHLNDDTVPSLEAFPPPRPALACEGSAKTTEWGDTTIIVRSYPRPKGYHWQVSGRVGGYVEGGWMDREVPDVDLLDQPVEDTWH